MRVPKLPAGVELTDGALSICPIQTDLNDPIARSSALGLRCKQMFVNPWSGSRNKTDSREIVVATIRPIKFRSLISSFGKEKKRDPSNARSCEILKPPYINHIGLLI
jgi:hypothetical protein